MNYEFLKKRRTAPDLRNQRKIRRSWKYWKKKIGKKRKKENKRKNKKNGQSGRLSGWVRTLGPQQPIDFYWPWLVTGFLQMSLPSLDRWYRVFSNVFFCFTEFYPRIGLSVAKRNAMKRIFKGPKKKRTSTWKPNNWLAMAARWGGGGGGFLWCRPHNERLF